jgi:hypothetical protein
MYQNYNYYPQQQPQVPRQQMNYNFAPPPVTGLKGRPVSSIEEARASSIDFDGSVFYFPDLANQRIYTKQINLDGTATLLMYELKELPDTNSVSLSNNFVTREEFESVITQIKNALLAPSKQTEVPAATTHQEVKAF